MPKPVDRRKAVAERARARAKEDLARSSGGNCVNWTGRSFEAKDGMTTLWTVIPYIVKERHHPDGAEPGELWYKRPYRRHPNQGPDRNKVVVCPKTFYGRNECAVCDQVVEWSKDYDTNKDSIDDNKAKNRDLFLVYDHDSKEVLLVDEAHGGGNMPGFGMLLAARITNPRQEDWAAFFLDGDDGMALEIQWKGAGHSGKKDWIKPISIDFIERKKAPVPKEVWGKAFELSELLIKTSSADIEKMFLDLPDEEVQPTDATPMPDDEEEDPDGGDAGDELARATRAELKDFIKEKGLVIKVYKSMTDDDIRDAIRKALPDEEEESPEPEPEQDEEEQADKEPDLGSMSKKELLSYAQKEFGLDVKSVRQLGAKSEKQIRQDLEKMWRDRAAEDPPSEAEAGEEHDNACPFGYKFGVDYNEKDECSKCAEASYEACMKAFDELKE